MNGSNDVDRSYNILETSDGYVIGGNTIVVSGNIYWWETFFTKIDFNGNIVYSKYLEEDSVDYFFSSYPGSIILDSNEFYSVCVRRTPTPDWTHDEAILMKLDADLDTVWTKRFGEHAEPYDTAYWFTSINKVQTDKLIIAGLWKPRGLPSHAYLIKTDLSGQIIWEKSYWVGDYTEAYDVSQTADAGFILGCIRYAPSNSYLHDPVIIKTDSLGNEEWIKNLGGDFMDNKAMVCMSKDSMIVVGTNYADSMDSLYVSFSKINIVKIDNAGNIIWNKKYGASQPANYLLNIRILDDNSIVTVGALRKDNPEPDFVGWILKTDANGDSIWYREYYNLPGQESRNYLYDVIPTSDNGLIACGYIDPYPPDTGSTDTWVIKLDSIGCEFAGCDTTVGVEEPGGGEAWGHGGVEIWPNPAKQVISVKSSVLRSGEDINLTVYDVFGRSAPTPALPHTGEGEVRWTIDVSTLPAGIYLAVVRNETGVVGSVKFVVAR